MEEKLLNVLYNTIILEGIYRNMSARSYCDEVSVDKTTLLRVCENDDDLLMWIEDWDKPYLSDCCGSIDEGWF